MGAEASPHADARKRSRWAGASAKLHERRTDTQRGYAKGGRAMQSLAKTLARFPRRQRDAPKAPPHPESARWIRAQMPRESQTLSAELEEEAAARKKTGRIPRSMEARSIAADPRALLDTSGPGLPAS